MNNRGLMTWGILASLTLAARGAEPVAPEQFEQLRSVIRPQPAEQKWEAIPWLSDLWEARKLAAAQGKPILLWEMDGHPLGCT